jgi:DNA-binding NarL/FixJ family response regulator
MHSAPAVVGPTAWTLHDEEVRTLGLVVAGIPDKAVANRLGVSHRTVQRRIRDLMQQAGARNRMQLGRHAALAGVRARTPDGGPPPSGAADPMSVRAVCRPDDTGVRLLWLLLADASWKAASDALGTSPRTVERRVHDLMAMAGATSRAQLGWYATFNGWF